MPFIHIRAYSGKDMETKKKVAQAIVEAASEAAGTPKTAYTVVYEDIDREEWEKNVKDPVIEPLRDMLIIEGGEFVEGI
ncbi:MAG: tautomerase family protein [Oscillospiraceae bacterium]|nr:tautomerase family protein [Oscillospiraceae bacterium]